MTDRRSFLLGALATLAACSRPGSGDGAATAIPGSSSTAAAPPTPTTTSVPVVPLATDPVDLPPDFFGLGVASGDPSPDGAVLWTRGLGSAVPDDLPVVWEVGADAGFDRLVATGRSSCRRADGHAVHVVVDA